MSNEIMIPEAGSLSTVLFNAELAALINDVALTGSASRLPRITTNGKQFVLVAAGGEETPMRAGDLTIGPDGNSYLPVIVLRAKGKTSKAWYMGAYDPNAENKSPDCFSNDGERPAADIPSPQCDTCALCPHNQWGSGTDAAGNLTKGKACSDSKVLAVFAKGAVYELKVMPTALRNWDSYVKKINCIADPSGNRLPLAFVKTLLGFDENAKHQLYTFDFGGVIGEGATDKIVKLVKSPEAADIVDRKQTYNAQGKALPAPAKEPAKKPAAKKPAAKKAAKPAPEPAVDDLGLDDAPAVELKVAEKQAPAEAPATDDLGLSDDDIANELGL